MHLGIFNKQLALWVAACVAAVGLGLLAWMFLGAARAQPAARHPSAPDAYRVVRSELPEGAGRGLSDLSLGPDGTLWAVAERQHWLVPLSARGNSVVLEGAPIPLSLGLRDGLDIEALAALGGGRFVLGTERKEEARHADDLYPAEQVDQHLRLGAAIRVSYKPWKLEAKANRGIEGLCAVGAAEDVEWIVAVEETDRRKGRRFAPVARYHPRNKAWGRYWVELTTEEGRLSGLACRAAADGGVQVRALERGPGVSRLVAFALPAVDVYRSKPARVAAILEMDLKSAGGAGFNPEGIAWLPDERLLILSDNSDEPGPTPLLLLSPRASATANPSHP